MHRSRPWGAFTVIHLTASAPGKLVVVGEYVVLEGHQALGVAVDRRVNVDWVTKSAGPSSMRFVPLVNQSLSYPLGESGDSAIAPETVDWVESILQGWAAEALHDPFSLTIDSQSLYDQQGHKLGLGSSAAVAVALAGIAMALAGQPIDDLPKIHHQLMALHQGAQGSGVDLAVALTGGAIRYQKALDTEQCAHWEEIKWPKAMAGLIVFSGRSASTPSFIRAYQAWQYQQPDQWRQTVDAMAECAHETIAALNQGDWTAFEEGFTEYGVRMGTMGGLMGQHVVTAEHHTFQTLAQTMGVAYKPCGAGGGDVGLFLSHDPDRLSALHAALAGIQIDATELSVAEEGLRVTRHHDLLG